MISVVFEQSCVKLDRYLEIGTRKESSRPRFIDCAARRGDARVRQLYHDAGRLVGIAMAEAINLLNPGRVIIGGGVSQAGELMLESLRDTACRHSVRATIGSTDTVPSTLGRRSTAPCAVALVLKATFSPE